MPDIHFITNRYSLYKTLMRAYVSTWFDILLEKTLIILYRVPSDVQWITIYFNMMSGRMMCVQSIRTFVVHIFLSILSWVANHFFTLFSRTITCTWSIKMVHQTIHTHLHSILETLMSYDLLILHRNIVKTCKEL